jgi:hypothetical protein
MTFAALPSGSRSIAGMDESITIGADLQRLTMSPFMLVGSIAASCRQTAVANQFLNWLAGGQGSEPLYRGIDSLLDLNPSDSPSFSSSSASGGYRPWLKSQLSNPNVLLTLQMIGAEEYYRALDEGVRSCLTGSTSASKACETISEAWEQLHRKYDRPTQQRVWRRAQGIG